ncbi:hypothetical protein ACL9RF_08675 [Sphingobacterium sp. Mn56C]|uniref:hypothetical protein n=1 Tax=Sphingobacterium sp. Mn56C TaxID=3395261 RepID=UPI003BD96CD2
MSPNINNQQAILLYPSTCLFEGTILNEGRGTQYPFTVIGSPALKGMYSFSFTPFSIKEMSGKPIYKDQVCYGLDLRKVDLQKLRAEKKVDLSWLIETYNTYPKKEIFFDKKRSKEIVAFEKLAGGTTLEAQIVAGLTAEDIRKSWQPGLKKYKEMRQQYVLYP